MFLRKARRLVSQKLLTEWIVFLRFSWKFSGLFLFSKPANDANCVPSKLFECWNLKASVNLDRVGMIHLNLENFMLLLSLNRCWNSFACCWMCWAHGGKVYYNTLRLFACFSGTNWRQKVGKKREKFSWNLHVYDPESSFKLQFFTLLLIEKLFHSLYKLRHLKTFSTAENIASHCSFGSLSLIQFAAKICKLFSSHNFLFQASEERKVFQRN